MFHFEFKENDINVHQCLLGKSPTFMASGLSEVAGIKCSFQISNLLSNYSTAPRGGCLPRLHFPKWCLLENLLLCTRLRFLLDKLFPRPPRIHTSLNFTSAWSFNLLLKVWSKKIIRSNSSLNRTGSVTSRKGPTTLTVGHKTRFTMRQILQRFFFCDIRENIVL